MVLLSSILARYNDFEEARICSLVFLPSLTALVIEHFMPKWSLRMEVTLTMSSCFLACGESEENSTL